MANQENPIVFVVGDETRHVIERIDDKVIEESLFSDQYKKSLSVLEEMFSRSGESELGLIDNPNNNIISFIGERGSGKTSCMMSVATLLGAGLKDEIKASYPTVAYHRFYCVDRIDPSFFDEKHNVIELFIAGLFNRFEKSYKSNDPSENKKVNDVIENFSCAQKTMAEMVNSDQDDSYDDLENLQRLSAGIRLSKNIHDLVDSFLEFEGVKNGVVLLPIDDIDLNSRQAADMLEQIRKYLIQSNIVILLSVKLDQLSLTKKLSLQKEFAPVFKSGSDISNDLSSVFDEMVDTYLSKTLPQAQRIYMPEGESFFYKKVAIVDKKHNRTEYYPTVRQMVPEMIFAKTRYLFYNSEERTSLIVPKNLRQLRMLVRTLYCMEDYWKRDKHIESNLYNKLVFRKYFFGTWVDENLNQSHARSVRELVKIQDAAQINADVLALLNIVFVNRLSSQDESNDRKLVSYKNLPQYRVVVSRHESVSNRERHLIFYKSNINYNIALGDVLDVIDQLEDSETDREKIRLLFFLRTFYSMRLYQEYDRITDSSKLSDTVFSKDNLSNYSTYEKLVAGFYINSRLSRLVPPQRGGSSSRASKLINYAKLKDLINDVTRPDIDVNSIDISKIQLIEFFMLGISRRIDTKDDAHGDQYRQERSVFYAESLESITKNAFFDIGALMFNLTRIDECYKRFANGEAFLNIVKSRNDSLRNCFYSKALNLKEGQNDCEYDESKAVRSWLSWCCFRNAEIIRAFKYHVESIKSPSNSDIEVLIKAFRKMGDFSIDSYDKDDNNSYFSINFGYFNLLADILEKSSMKNDFDEIFNTSDSLLEHIEIEKILSGAQAQNNRVDTRIRKIERLYPIIGYRYKDEIHQVFDKYGKYISKSDLRDALYALEDKLKKYREEE